MVYNAYPAPFLLGVLVFDHWRDNCLFTSQSIKSGKSIGSCLVVRNFLLQKSFSRKCYRCILNITRRDLGREADIPYGPLHRSIIRKRIP